MIYCRFLPLTFMDLVPEVRVGDLLQPDEGARLVRGMDGARESAGVLVSR